MTHLNKKQMSNAIYQPNKDEEVLEDETIAYTFLLRKVNPSDDEAYAKEVTFNGYTTFYVKSYNNRLFNPLGLNDERIHSLSRIRFVSVPKKVYADYLRFLESKNPVWLTHAERKNK